MIKSASGKETHHERPLLDLVHDDGAALGHPRQQHGDAADGQPADVQAAGRRVQLVDFGASRPEGHQPAPGEHWRHTPKVKKKSTTTL